MVLQIFVIFYDNTVYVFSSFQFTSKFFWCAARQVCITYQLVNPLWNRSILIHHWLHNEEWENENSSRTTGVDLGFSWGGLTNTKGHNIRGLHHAMYSMLYTSLVKLLEGWVWGMPPGKFWELVSLKLNLRAFSVLYF